jgi:hypothetical protein
MTAHIQESQIVKNLIIDREIDASISYCKILEGKHMYLRIHLFDHQQYVPQQLLTLFRAFIKIEIAHIFLEVSSHELSQLIIHDMIADIFSSNSLSLELINESRDELVDVTEIVLISSEII